MGTYIIKGGRPSLEKLRKDFYSWQSSGYTGSYGKFLADKLPDAIRMNSEVTEEQFENLADNVSEWEWLGPIFINGDFGAHCHGCAAPSDNLCDYPVGEGLTCDRPLCEDHSYEVGRDMHYCEAHHGKWKAFSSKDMRLPTPANRTIAQTKTPPA